MKVDDLISKLGNSGNDTVQSAKDLAKDLLNTGKDKLNMSRLRQDLREAYRELGELTYVRDRSHVDNSDTIVDIERRIDEILAQLSEF